MRLSQRATAILAMLLVIIGVAVATADARPGGGETYSRPGGGDTYSSGGRSSDGWDSSDRSSGGDEALFALIWFVMKFLFRHPMVGGGLVLFVAAFMFVLSRDSGGGNWDSSRAAMLDTTATVEAPPPLTLEAITRVDPDFSTILFEDFVFRLYAATHHARGEGKLDELAPYISPEARTWLARRQPTGPVTGVVIGSMQIRNVTVPDTSTPPPPTALVKVQVTFEANYSVAGSRRFVIEDWTLERAVTARTKPREPGQRFACPNCGAPWRTGDAAGTQKCSSCGEVVDNGRFDWRVKRVGLRDDRDNIPGLNQEIPERGTSSPSVKEADVDAQWAAFQQDDPAVTNDSFVARLTHVYTVLNDSWSRGDISPARTVLSDGLADYMQYWLDAYAQQNYRNVLEDMRMTGHVIVKLRRDRYYDAVTVRIWGTGKDYVVRTTDGRHIRGSASSERAYSEYWTLIRAAGRRGAPRTDATCGGCGAPLIVSMAGSCSHCGAHVTSGEFDWVLSKIEQDDTYGVVS